VAVATDHKTARNVSKAIHMEADEGAVAVTGAHAVSVDLILGPAAGDHTFSAAEVGSHREFFFRFSYISVHLSRSRKHYPKYNLPFMNNHLNLSKFNEIHSFSLFYSQM